MLISYRMRVLRGLARNGIAAYRVESANPSHLSFSFIPPESLNEESFDLGSPCNQYMMSRMNRSTIPSATSARLPASLKNRVRSLGLTVFSLRLSFNEHRLVLKCFDAMNAWHRPFQM